MRDLSDMDRIIDMISLAKKLSQNEHANLLVYLLGMALEEASRLGNDEKRLRAARSAAF